MRKPQDKSIARDKNERRRRKKVRVYAILACRKDDPSDLYGVMYHTARKGGRSKPTAVKGRTMFRTVVSKPEDGISGAAQRVWNDARAVIRKITARGRVKTRVKHVAKPPMLPYFPGTCYNSVKTTVDAPHDKMRVGRRVGEKDRLVSKRMPLEDFRFFVTRIWSKSCPIEFSPEDDRRLRAFAYGHKTSAPLDRLCLKFSAKKDFNFKWGGGRNAPAGLSRRDHEPGSVESEAQAGDHKPVNPVALDVNVLRKPGIQSLGPDEMRKDANLKRSDGEGDTRVPVRNSESAALSYVPVSGTRGDAPPRQFNKDK